LRGKAGAVATADSAVLLAGGLAAAYVRGNVASHGGHNWTASQWNYDEVPGGPSGAWNDDGPC